MEYFCFPQKFFFFELSGLDRLRAAGFGGQAEIIFLISPFERGGTPADARNRHFRQDLPHRLRAGGESVPADGRTDSAGPDALRISGDPRRRPAQCHGGLFASTRWSAPIRASQEVFHFEPFYSFRHGAARDNKQAFWHAARRPSGRRNDEGTEMFISLVDLSGRSIRPDAEALTVRTTCTNRDLPSRLPFGNDAGDFELEGAAPIKRIVALPNPPIRCARPCRSRRCGG